MLQRILKPLFFAMLLVFAQQAALLHGYAHTSDTQYSTQNEKQVPNPTTKHHDACGQCLATADLGSALGAHSFIFSLNAAQLPFSLTWQLSVSLTPLFSYQSRAPPLLA